MDAQFKRVVFPDEGFVFPLLPKGILGILVGLFREFRPPDVLRIVEFPNYALGFKWSATERERELIRSNHMEHHVALQLHDNFPALTFAQLLGDEFIPEVNPSQAELLKIEARVREAALKWTLFFQNLDPED